LDETEALIEYDLIRVYPIYLRPRYAFHIAQGAPKNNSNKIKSIMKSDQS